MEYETENGECQASLIDSLNVVQSPCAENSMVPDRHQEVKEKNIKHGL